MTEFLLKNEVTIRLAAFLGILIVMMIWEAASPRRSRLQTRRLRWVNNLAIVMLNAVALRLLFPITIAAAALHAETQDIGLFNQLDWPGWLEILLAILIFDLVIYGQHVVSHAVPVFWRLHRMHHADVDFDVTTGSRFHPVEILLSATLKIGIVYLIGPAAVAVILFEILLNATAMFNHANARLPLGVDRALRWLVVTPDMHRVHHSVVPSETNSNFGFNLPWWDRLFGTYRNQPVAGHSEMTIGLAAFRTRRDQRLDNLLIQPFVGPTMASPVRRVRQRSSDPR